MKNYFEVSYTPKGRISPGITCDIKFKFLPQLNEDINSEFSILAETGQINFPIICTSKKAIIRCSQPVLNFGKVIEGEVGNTKLKIQNEGALKTQM